VDDSRGSSYPRLAEELRRIGAPKDDLIELFGRMIFNAVVGNDDDHPRNHAIIFNKSESRWRLAPAFDVVPNPDETPRLLVMQVSSGRREINREALLADYVRFGFASKDDAADYMDRLVKKIQETFDRTSDILSPALRELMSERIRLTSRRLAETGSAHEEERSAGDR
jgi:serine/threonine-protein kinase HipA